MEARSNGVLVRTTESGRAALAEGLAIQNSVYPDVADRTPPYRQ
ncbi:hypothetical protein [Methyloferula stellata]|nr:hypothetical protein [Methyloferula stellata]